MLTRFDLEQAWRRWWTVPVVLHRVQELAGELVGAIESLRSEIAASSPEDGQLVTVSVLVNMRRAGEGPEFQTMIGAKTELLLAGEVRRYRFAFRSWVYPNAVIWLHGPGVVQKVFVGNQMCSPLDDGGAAGVAAVVPMPIEIGQALEIDVVGVLDRLLRRHG